MSLSLSLSGCLSTNCRLLISVVDFLQMVQSLSLWQRQFSIEVLSLTLNVIDPERLIVDGRTSLG